MLTLTIIACTLVSSAVFATGMETVIANNPTACLL